MRALTISFILAYSCLSPSLWGQAYCALRDPLSTIQKFSSESSGHRSITEMVGGAARKSVSEHLPFTIHFNEMGKHTLYVVLKEDQPEGLVHARSEKGKWGLVEIVWFLDLDLKIRDFSFQRCRDRSKTALESDAFKAQLRGKSFSEVRKMLNGEGESIVEGEIKVASKAMPLAVTTLRSALKTMHVTKVVWKDHLAKLRAESKKQANASTRANHDLVPVPNVYNRSVLKILSSIQQEEEWIIDRKSVTLHRSTDRTTGTKGLVLKTRCTAEEDMVEVSWAVDKLGRIAAVTPTTVWPASDIEEAFTGLESITLDQIRECSTPGQLAAAEVLAISKAHLMP